MPSKSAKIPNNNSGRKSNAASGKSTSSRMTVAVLAQNLKSLETRLKGADAKNRKALKVLEGVVDDIQSAAIQSKISQKAALTRGLNTLEVRMETYLERAAAGARAGVRSELARVTASGADLTTLEDAVTASHARLDELDRVQREALARLNRHVANIATSVEARLSSEAKAREASTAALETKIDSVRKSFETRVDQVEQDAAIALGAVGDKITEFAAALEDRAKTSDVDTAERLADLAQETQSEFSAVQSDVTARLEALEMIASTWTPQDQASAIAANPYLPANADDPRIDQMGEMIESLQEELGRMHARMAGVQPADSAPQSNVVPMSNIAETVPENPYASAVRALEISAVDTPTAAIDPTPPYESKPAPAPSTAQSHIPQEFDPAAFSSAPQPPLISDLAPMPAPMPTASISATPPALPLAPLAAPMANPAGFPPAQTEPVSHFQGEEPLMPAPLPLSTYEDPAYAEGDDMRAERIGGATPKRKASSKPVISGRNIRVGALALGVSVLGLFAAKTILGGPAGDTTQVRQDAPIVSSAQGNIETAALDTSTNSQVVSASTPPIGQYSDMQAPALEASGQDTLDAAVRAGNPIAQFQKGLVQLQAGQMEEGARLIRLSANRNQPAAQYRLAKLYESGTGIGKDTVTARGLIERAAAGGNRIAMHDLGNYHAYGQGGLDRDMSAALEWFTKAAERGVVDSQFNVAFLREGNEGVPADLETALFWYQVAARQGDQGAPDRIEVLSAQMEPKALADIKTRADRFNPKPVDEAANGIFRDVPWAKKPSAQTQAASAEIIQIREAQTLLSSLGYKVGTPDGVAGAKTRTAIKAFEAVNGMSETGQISDELIRKLEIATGA